MNDGTKKTILFVEDETLIAMNHEDELETLGYRVITVHSGEKAVEVCRENKRIDIILMDMNLKEGIDGTEAAEIILKDREIPIVFLSNHIEPEIVEKTEKITSYGYVVKNSGISVLDASIKMAFKLFEAKEEIKASHSRLLSIFDSLDEPIYVSDPGSYKILYINNASKEIFGDHRDKKCYQHFQNRDSPCSFCTNDKIFGKYLGKSYIWEFQNEVNRRWYRCIDKAIEWPDGSMVRYEMAVDITDRRQAEESLKESEKKYRLLADNVVDVVLTLDLKLNFTYISPSIEPTSGFSVEEMMTQPLSKSMTPDSQAESIRILKEELALEKKGTEDPSRSRTFQVDMFRKDGSIYTFEMITSFLRNNESEAVGLIGIGRDITERKKAETEIRKFKAISDQANFGTAIVDMEGNIMYINSAYTKMNGYSDYELYGENVSTFFSEDRISKVIGTNRIQRKEGDYSAIEVWHRRKDGTDFPALMNFTIITDENGKEYCISLTAIDITEKKKTDEYMKYLATKDHLTGANNRKVLYEYIEKNIDDYQADPRTKAILAIDFDNFKWINDNNSHAVGDELLKQFTRRVESCLLKSDDALFRLGGDEFIIFLNNINSDIDASLVVEKIHQECIAMPYLISIDDSEDDSEIEINLSMSIGISVFPRDGTASKKLLKHADLALLHAKKQGKNQYSFFNDDMNRRDQERIETRKKIVRSLENDYLSTFFQPIIRRDGKIFKCEALARIIYPDEGIISPAVFIPVAEKTGLIEDIGYIIMEKAMRAAETWNRQGREILASINVSSRQFTENFYDRVMSILEKTGCDPGLIFFEITEETIMSDPDSVIRKMKLLRKEGLRFSIDDFGTGHSSFSRMRDLPLDEIKIDRSFVRNIADGSEGELNRTIIRSIIEISKARKLSVVVEGAETIDELKILYELGCDAIQGFYFSKPVPFEDFSDLIDKTYLIP